MRERIVKGLVLLHFAGAVFCIVIALLMCHWLPVSAAVFLVVFGTWIDRQIVPAARTHDEIARWGRCSR